jgi:SSS family solute:Na+ symporter
MNAKGCLSALVVGFLLGAFRLAVDTPVALGLGHLASGYTPGSFLWIVNNIYFQYYSELIFLVSILVMVGVSYMTAEPAYERISGLTFGTVTDEHRKESRSSWNKQDVIYSVLICLVILTAYLYFRG